jgi:hypothetical protein
MPQERPQPVAPEGLSPAQKAELRGLLARVPEFDPSPDQPYQLDPVPPELITALEFVESCGVRAGLPAGRCYGGEWFVSSEIMGGLRRLAS